jgi:hypothetical protein
MGSLAAGDRLTRLHAPIAGFGDPNLWIDAKAHVASFASHRRDKSECPLAVTLRRSGFQPQPSDRTVSHGLVPRLDPLGP